MINTPNPSLLIAVDNPSVCLSWSTSLPIELLSERCCRIELRPRGGEHNEGLYAGCNAIRWGVLTRNTICTGQFVQADYHFSAVETLNATAAAQHHKFSPIWETRKFTHRASKRRCVLFAAVWHEPGVIIRRVLFAAGWREPGVVCYHI